MLGHYRSVRPPTDRKGLIGRDQCRLSRCSVSELGSAAIQLVLVILAGRCFQLTDLVGVLGETSEVADREPGLDLDASPDGGDAVAGSAEAAAAVTVLDRFLAAGLSRETFDAHLAAGRIAVAGHRVTDPATPAPPLAAVAIMVDSG